ncbi:alpha/beta fold hydrolase, partial [Lactobacillus sp. XV13L]|nr:alpha/beta fold hydrolase [Lactobacillus sp. XV13L]
MLMKIDNKEIYYEVMGVGPAVIFCHGFGGSHVVWSEQVNYLVKSGYQTITIDLPGHGKTIGPAAGTMKELADEIAQLIQNLNLKTIILIGHSMGVGLIWGLLKYHPELVVDKVIAVDQTPKMLNDVDWNFGWTNGQLRLTKDNFQQVLIENKHVKETLNGIDSRVWKKLFPFKKKYPFNRAKNLPLLLDHVQKDWRNVAVEMTMPTLMVSSA